jgi:hypothetical protein
VDIHDCTCFYTPYLSTKLAYYCTPHQFGFRQFDNDVVLCHYKCGSLTPFGFLASSQHLSLLVPVQ